MDEQFARQAVDDRPQPAAQLSRARRLAVVAGLGREAGHGEVHAVGGVGRVDLDPGPAACGGGGESGTCADHGYASPPGPAAREGDVPVRLLGCDESGGIDLLSPQGLTDRRRAQIVGLILAGERARR